MNRLKCRKPEILAPAGSFNGMRAAINAGADAVYIGGSKFGARAYADNPDEKGVIEAIEFCHLRDRKLYLTVNTLLKEKEVENELFSYLLPFYKAGLDAVIVQDIGVMEFIGKNFPGMDIHISTQASITCSKGIDGIRGLLSKPESITRVVPARELSLQELKKMREETDIEMEVFVQGALCCCYSGQCLLSSLAGGRSGNRGRCAQPCRRLYDTEIAGKSYKGYYLSPKDMCVIGRLNELIDIGIASFKIEGRMKSEEYAAGVVSVFREYIDAYLSGENEAALEKIAVNGTKIIRELYNRGGFNEGYLFNHNGQDMMSTKRNGHYGVNVGEIIKKEGRKAYIKTNEAVAKGDVLEVRDFEKDTAFYEFTAGDNYDSGTVFSILTMKDRTASIGEKVFRTKNASLLKELHQKYVEEDSKAEINIYLKARVGEPLYLKMEQAYAGENDNNSVFAEIQGQGVQKALTSRLSSEELKNLITKLGNTEFCAAKVIIDSDDDIFISVQELKSCRRECAAKLRDKILGKKRRENVSAEKNLYEEKRTEDKGNEEKKAVIVSAKSVDQVKWVIDSDKAGIITDIYIDMTCLFSERNDFTETVHEAEKILTLAAKSRKRAVFKLPRILRYSYFDKVRELCDRLKNKTFFIAANYESIALLNEIKADYRTDHSIYVFNNISKSLIKNGYTLPVELNETELKPVADEDGEIIVYGLLPAMISAQCVYKTITGKCGEHPDIYIKDEKGFNFRTHSECVFCFNYVYNSAVQNLFHRIDAVKQIGCERFRAELTFEDENETRLVVRALEGLTKASAENDNDKNGDVFPTEIMGLKYTNGHFNRGVE